MRRLLLSFALFFALTITWAQKASQWTPRNGTSGVTQHKSVSRSGFPSNYKLYDLDVNTFRNNLMSVAGWKTKKSIQMALPNASGELEDFELSEASNFDATLQARFPQIRSFSGKSLKDATSVIRVSIDAEGVQAMIMRANGDHEYIEPFSADKKVYASFKKQRSAGQMPWACTTADQAMMTGINNRVMAVAAAGNSGSIMRTMRLAQSCNGEYSNYFGATSSADVAKVLAAFNATLTRSNGVYEKDLALHLNLIDQTTNVIYYSASTDPYTTMSSWNNQLQTALNANIGAANYDIGHMFGASGGGGNAGCIGCVCNDSNKGSGITSPADGIPQGDNFDIDYVVHEVGHQLGANHTFSMSNEGTGVNKEVGSGITIMGYAGITSQDVARHSIDIFHQASISQILTNLATKTCPVSTDISAVNTPPVVAAGVNYTIPISTPFILTGSATGAANETLTYCWEQNDNASSGQTGTSSVASATKASGPNWISFSPSTSPSRTFPQLSTILAGSNVTGPLTGGDAGANTEALSSVARTLNFRLTVRDNVPYSSVAPLNTGQTAFTDVVITVASSGPFNVTWPNTTSAIWENNSTQNVTWSVNNTNTSPVNCTAVRILLSTDGGQTFPTVLADNTPNDGTEAITLSMGTLGSSITNARIKVEAVGNIFFDISNTDFTISPPALCGLPGGLASSAVAANTATLSWNAVTNATSYTVGYKLASSNTWTTLATQATTTVNLTGLTQGSLYDWRVLSTCPAGSGNYASAQFTTIIPTCQSALDNNNNDNIAGASTIALNTNVNGLINPSKDIDNYKFVITTGGSLTVSLSTLPANYNLKLLNSAGSQVGSSAKSGTTAESIAYTAAAGTYYAQVYPNNNSAFNANSCYTLKITTGTAARSSAVAKESAAVDATNRMIIFPNPADQALNIEHSWLTGSADLIIVNMQGKKLMSRIAEGSATQLDISELPKGLYIVRMNFGKTEIRAEKFIKQ